MHEFSGQVLFRLTDILNICLALGSNMFLKFIESEIYANVDINIMIEFLLYSNISKWFLY